MYKRNLFCSYLNTVNVHFLVIFYIFMYVFMSTVLINYFFYLEILLSGFLTFITLLWYNKGPNTDWHNMATIFNYMPIEQKKQEVSSSYFLKTLCCWVLTITLVITGPVAHSGMLSSLLLIYYLQLHFGPIPCLARKQFTAG